MSITKDYTFSERQLIRQFALQAKEKNFPEPEESNYVWRVRGTPRNGLLVKKIAKVNAQSTN